MIALKINNREIEDRIVHEEWEAVKNHFKKNPDFPQLSSSLTLRYTKENIINRVILEEQAEVTIDEIDFKLIQEEYKKFLDHYGGREGAELHFREQRREFSHHQIKANIEKSLKVDRLLEMWTEDVSLPNEGEMSSYYESHREKFMAPKKILFSKFFLPIDSEPDPHNRVLMEGLVQHQNQVNDYKDFLNKARQIPGMDYQEKFYLIPGQIQAQIEEVLLQLQDGEISQIIQAQEGYFIFKRWSALPPQELEYHQVRESIEKILFEEKKQKRIRENLAQLRKQVVVEDFISEGLEGEESLFED